MHNQFKKNAATNWPPEMLNILDFCQQIHEQAEEVYQYLAGIHSSHQQIARMWGLLAIDKCNHADTFKMAFRLKGAGIGKITVSSEMAATILNKLKKIPKGGHVTAPTIVEALRFAVKMEESLIGLHIRLAVKFDCAQSTALMGSSLKSSDEILHMLTEEYVNLTLLESDTF